MKSRLQLPTPATMTPEQRAIHESVLSTRGNASGPFLAWLLSPGLAEPAQQLGAFCRYNSLLTLQESELLICLVAAQYECPAEQAIHEPIARRAGLSEAALAAIRAGAVPSLETPRLQLLEEVGRELLSRKKLPDALYARAVEALGEQTLVEVVGIVGYYALVAYTLNAFDMKLA
jgi:4-carboxymuconolactone decarboxylase